MLFGVVLVLIGVMLHNPVCKTTSIVVGLCCMAFACAMGPY